MSAPFSICVFCGARPGTSPRFEAAAKELGETISAQGWRLVYGAGDQGIMGAVANAVRERSGRALGVIPEHLVTAARMRQPGTDIVVTETMHERKKVMYVNSDAFVILPGGAGTLDEFFEILTWKQLGRHDKPIVIINIDGYWDALGALLQTVQEQGFDSVEDIHRLVFEDDERDFRIVSDILKALGFSAVRLLTKYP